MFGLTVRIALTAAFMLGAFELGRRHPAGEPPGQRPVPVLPVLIPPPAPTALVQRDAGPTIEQVRRLESLVVSRVDVADVCTTDIQGYVGGSRAALVVRGDFVVAVDLAHARFESRDAGKRTVALVLPQPRVSRPRVDQASTRLVELSRRGLWMAIPWDAGQSAAVNHAYEHAQRVVAAAGADAGVVERARADAEQTLTTFFRAVGWAVTIRWASP